jgi:hypothetical protein
MLLKDNMLMHRNSNMLLKGNMPMHRNSNMLRKDNMPMHRNSVRHSTNKILDQTTLSKEAMVFRIN